MRVSKKFHVCYLELGFNLRNPLLASMSTCLNVHCEH